jgi:toxin ParE1/3/4
MKALVVHRLAQAELAKAVRYLERLQRGLGLALQEEVEETTTRIQANPQIGTPYGVAGLQFVVLHRFPYVVYYKEFEHTVWVPAIVHAHRRPGYWRRRRQE